ncbi:MAG TPA: hypothetical protein VGI83_03515 [Gemmatimonadales bacterium]
MRPEKREEKSVVASYAVVVFALLGLGTAPLAGQSTNDSSTSPGFSIGKFAAGFATSLAAHESAHVLTALAVGGHPSFGFNQFRPVIHSGIDTAAHPSRQVAFSAAGMTMQLVLDEIILDAPHGPGRAGAFEKGMLASGIGTVIFYFTIGRDASVSDVSQMAVNSGASKWTLTAMFGSVAVLDAVRVVTRQRYAHFFTAPTSDGRVAAGVGLEF